MAVATHEVLAKRTAQQVPVLANKNLISDQLWARLTKRIVKDEGIEPALAERIMDQALGFLLLCGQNTSSKSYSPSKQVDIGWHTFILYTREYQQFCKRVAGRFIHHEPSDVPGVDYGTGNMIRTAEAMKAHGIVVDEGLWNQQATNGSGCSGDCKMPSCRCDGCSSGCVEP